MQTNQRPDLSDYYNRRYASGARDVLYDLLAARGITLDERQRQIIDACEDVFVLRKWAVRVVTASSAEEVLG